MDNTSVLSFKNNLNSSSIFEEHFVQTFLIEKIYKLVITIIGIIGNGGTIIILTNKRNRKSSTAIYLTALAVSDILIILFGPFCDWLEIMLKVILKNYGDFTCKLQTYILYSSSSTSSWLLVAVTIEKVFSVTLPYRVRSSCNRKLTLGIIITTWTVLYVTNVHFLFGMGHTYNRLCDAVSGNYMKFTLYVLPWVDFCICFVVPFIFISFGNVIIIRKLAVSRVQRQLLTNSKVSKNISVSLILITVNIVFIVTVGPIHTFSIIFPYVKDTLNPQKVIYLQKFWGPMLNGLWELNAAINMVLYILSGTKFRKEIKNLLCCTKSNSDIFGVFDNSGHHINRIHMNGGRRQRCLDLKRTDNVELELTDKNGPRTNKLYA